MAACAQRMTCAQRLSSVLGLRGTHARRVQNLCIVGAFFRTHIDIRKINLTIFLFLDPQIIIAEYKWDIMPPRKSAQKTAGKGRPRNNQHHCSNHAGIIEKSIPHREKSPRKVFYIENILSEWFSM